MQDMKTPLRGKALASKVVAAGLVQRTKIVRVDARTLREELNMAEGRRKMKIERRYRQRRRCNHVVMLKTKRLECVQAIKAQAIATG
jgi:hypothetical protein